MNTNTPHQQQVGALIGCATYPVLGEGRATLPEQITALETGVLKLGKELTTLREENTTLKANGKTAQERAVEIAAANGHTAPAAADTDKGDGKDVKAEVTGLEGVEAMYRKKYELGNNGRKGWTE